MKKGVTKQPGWKFIASTLLIGGLLSLQNYGMFAVFPKSTPYWLLPLLVTFLSGFLVVSAIFQQKTLGPWAFPAVGGLLWELLWFLPMWQPRTASIWLYLLLIASSIIGLIIIYIRRSVISGNSIVIVGAIIASVGLLEFFRTSTNLDFFSAVLISVLNLIVHTIPILALGLLVAQEHGSTAVLLVTACLPFLIEEYLDNDISHSILTSYALETRITVAAFQLMPFLVFLILIPIWTSNPGSFKTRKKTLGLISFLAIGCLAFMRVFYLQASDAQFSLAPWAMWIYFVIFLCSPLLLAVSLYGNYEPESSTLGLEVVD